MHSIVQPSMKSTLQQCAITRENGGRIPVLFFVQLESTQYLTADLRSWRLEPSLACSPPAAPYPVTPQLGPGSNETRPFAFPAYRTPNIPVAPA